MGGSEPPSARAASGEQSKIEVQVRVTIPRVHEISLPDNRFKAELKLEASWVDPDPRLGELYDYLRQCESNSSKKEISHKPTESEVGGSGNFFGDKKSSDLYEIELPKDGPEGEQRKQLLANLKEEPFFAPRLMFSNMVNSESERQWLKLTWLEGERVPTVRFNWFVTGTFQHAME